MLELASVFASWSLFSTQGASAADDDRHIEAAALAARDAASNSGDQFAEPIASRAGEAFRLVIPVVESGGLSARGGGPVWRFDGAAFHLSAGLGFVVAPRIEMYRALPFRKSSEGRDGYVGVNAYGASKSVSASSWEVNAVAFIRAPTMEYSEEAKAFEDRRLYPHDPSPPDDYTLEIQARGADARALSSDLELVVDGSITALSSNGGTAICGMQRRRPTLDAPEDIVFRTCYVGAVVNRVAYVRRSTGVVLKEFKLIP